jgi:hypothetical protein
VGDRSSGRVRSPTVELNLVRAKTMQVSLSAADLSDLLPSHCKNIPFKMGLRGKNTAFLSVQPQTPTLLIFN